MTAKSKLICGTITGLIIGIALIAVGALMLSGLFGGEGFLYKIQGKLTLWLSVPSDRYKPLLVSPPNIYAVPLLLIHRILSYRICLHPMWSSYSWSLLLLALRCHDRRCQKSPCRCMQMVLLRTIGVGMH